MSLELIDVSKHFGAQQVLRNVSLAFTPGSVTSLVGDNGAGKSTLLKVLAGTYGADGGHVTLKGAPLTTSSAKAHRKAGIEMVYQDFALAKSHDLATNLFLGREQSVLGVLRRRAMAAEATRIISELGIEFPNFKRPVGVFSCGQQQAVAIARALLFDPKVLLLDEPTAALAVREVDRVLAFIRAEREKGRIILLVSHRLNDVFAVSDRIVVLKQGQVVSDDPASSLTMADVIERIVR